MNNKSIKKKYTSIHSELLVEVLAIGTRNSNQYKFLGKKIRFGDAFDPLGSEYWFWKNMFIPFRRKKHKFVKTMDESFVGKTVYCTLFHRIVARVVEIDGQDGTFVGEILESNSRQYTVGDKCYLSQEYYLLEDSKEGQKNV